jgi:transposase
MYKKYATWTDQAVFDAGVWINTDETKIKLSTSDGKSYCRRRHSEDVLNPKFVQQEERHGRFGTSLCVWGGIHLEGVTELIRVDGNLDRFQYVEILQKGLLPLYDYYDTHPTFRPTFLVFQQDNDPKHTSRHAKDFFRDEGIDVMAWAPKSPDVSPVENVWSHLKQEIRKHPRYTFAKTADDLYALANDVWHQPEFIAYAIHCYHSFPRRLEALKANNFYWIDY